MTLKYESEILFDLMKRDGDDTPSDVLPYESELKEKYLEQVEGAYPKLQDYRSEWLNYNLNAHLPADFPVETLSNVTEATVDNVVPYAFRSAILKGQTLVNLLKQSNKITVNANGTWNTSKTNVINNSMIKLSTTYTLITYVHNNTIADGDGYIVGVGGANQTNYIFTGNQIIPPQQTGVFKKLLTTKTDTSLEYKLQQVMYSNSTQGTIVFSQVLLEGDYTNADIPYFEGMQSVKMPVLKATGKNLFNVTKSNGYYTYSNGNWVNNEGFKTLSARVLPNTNYTQNMERNNITFWRDEVFVSGIVNSPTFTTPTNCNEVRVSCSTNFETFMLEMGEVATSYEPHKSNILTVNEEAELRGIGEIQDELNLLTGELTQRIGEVVLDGSEVWIKNGSNNQRFFYYCQDYGNGQPRSSNLLSDKTGYNVETEIVTLGNITTTGKIQLGTNFATGAELKEWLSSNPLTVQYQLATESVKTVDLTVTDQDGNTESIIRPIEGTMHLSTSGETIKPTFSGEIPVEAITQNLASFIEE